MSSVTDIRAIADVLGWHRSETDAYRDTFLLGGNMIAVDYKHDGTVGQASRYLFYRLADLQLQETIGSGRYKKERVIGWLARLA